MSDLAQLTPEVQSAWRRMDRQFISTGEWPRTRSAARSIAESCDANADDVLALAGFVSPRASAPARRIAQFIHGRKLRQ